MPVLQPVVQKLTRSNFSMWKALVISALKGTQFSEFLEGKADVQERTLFSDDKKMKMPNLEFAIHCLLSSLSKEMLEYVATYSTPEEVWENLITMAST
jgi:hypothetical protein